MTGLHDPLKPASPRFPPGRWIVLVPVVLVLVGIAVWSVFQTSDDSVRVALDQPTVQPAQSDPKDKSQRVVVAVVDGSQRPTPTAPRKPAEPVSSPKTSAKPVTPDAPRFTPSLTSAPSLQRWRAPADMVEASQYGPLPKISDGNVRPLDLYAEPVSSVGAARIAIVVGGLGISQTGTQKAIKDLPSAITLAFAPQGNSLKRWMETARKAGHETVLQIPMQPLGFPAVNPGPHTLVAGLGAENIDHLHWSLGRMTSYPLVMNYLGGDFLSKPDDLRPVLVELRNRGLAWFDDGSVGISQSIAIAQSERVPHVAGNLVIDNSRDPARIATQLNALTLLAQRRGYAVGSATAFPETIVALAKWAGTAEKAGIQLVPLSNLVKDFSR